MIEFVAQRRDAAENHGGEPGNPAAPVAWNGREVTRCAQWM
jgi:hypothetical protein